MMMMMINNNNDNNTDNTNKTTETTKKGPPQTYIFLCLNFFGDIISSTPEVEGYPVWGDLLMFLRCM